MNENDTATPRMQQYAGLAYSVRICQPMFSEGVALEKELSSALAQVNAMRGALEACQSGLQSFLDLHPGQCGPEDHRALNLADEALASLPPAPATADTFNSIKPKV